MASLSTTSLLLHPAKSLTPSLSSSSPLPFPLPLPLSRRSLSLSLSLSSLPLPLPLSRISAMARPGDDLPADYTRDDPWSKMAPRRAGVLLHPTSLPGPYGIGELGGEARAFLDWLETTGCTIWQVLPLVPPGRGAGEDGSPYAGQDANCGNTLLLSLDDLVADGLLEESDLPEPIPVAKVDFDEVARVKDPLIRKAAKKLVESSGPLKDDLEAFKKDPNISGWLPDAALFAAVREGGAEGAWWQWPAELRDREEGAMEGVRREQGAFMEWFIAEQFLFQRQWQALHAYAAERGVRIVGDMPIYVGGHSADVWANREQFMLDPTTGEPALVSGVPPDAFSATGQLWGSPLYNWAAMERDGYAWWAQRMRRAFDLYDEFRIDHFRGLAGYWAIEAGSETAMNGIWKQGPGIGFFDAIKAAVGKVDIIAEDLGVITSDVISLRKAIDAPGMAVLQFAFGSNSRNPHLPHNHEVNQVVYPGTHDNETVVGWWKKVGEREKANTLKYLRGEEPIHWAFIRAAAASPALTAIVALQDVLGLDNAARMNTPATQKGNWGWRVGESGAFLAMGAEAAALRGLLADYNRLPRGAPAKAVQKEEGEGGKLPEVKATVAA